MTTCFGINTSPGPIWSQAIGSALLCSALPCPALPCPALPSPGAAGCGGLGGLFIGSPGQARERNGWGRGRGRGTCQGRKEKDRTGQRPVSQNISYKTFVPNLNCICYKSIFLNLYANTCYIGYEICITIFFCAFIIVTFYFFFLCRKTPVHCY